MKPLIVLILTSAIAAFVLKYVNGFYNLRLAARIGITVMLLFTALGHFMFTEGMSLMIPKFIPFKRELVYFTAVIEISAAAGLHFSQFRTLTGWLLIAFFILILPANIKASLEHLDYQKATFDGNGIAYLAFRIPLQFLFIAWVYFSSIRL